MRAPAAIMCRVEGYNGVVKEEFIVPPSLTIIPHIVRSSFFTASGRGKHIWVGETAVCCTTVSFIIVLLFIFRGDDAVNQAG